MTTTLKTTGIATNCTLCLMVNPDTNLLQDFASAAVTSTLTVDAGVTISAGTWNGAARSYAQLGTNVNFIGFGANKPQVKLNSITNQELTVVGIFETASFGTRVFGPDASNYFGTNIQSSPSPAIKYYLTPPTSGSGANFAAGEKWLFGFSCVSEVSTTVYKAKHDAASVFTEAATNILPGSPGALSWVLDWVCRRTDSTTQQADKLYAVLVFNKALTAAEWDTLRVDWRGTLLSTTADTTPPTLTGSINVTAITTTTATLTWPAGADNTAVTSYETSLDGTTWTDRGNVLTIGLTGLTANTAYTARVRAKDAAGNVSTPAITGAFTTTAAGDTTAPVLTSPVGTGGSLVCSGSVNTDEANGTLYAVVCASATPPTAVQVEAGQDSTGAAGLRVVSQAVTATGTQIIASGAVTAGMRYMYFMQKDAAGNRSTVSSTSSFVVTAAAAATATTLTGPSTGTVSVASTNFTVGANGTITGTVVVTPSDSGGGGTFSPTTVSISSGSPTGTFIYTPGSAGAKTISTTNNGSLTNPTALTYTASSSTVTFTSEILRDEFGLVLASLAMSYYRLYNVSTGALVVSKTGLSTDSLGKVSFSDAALTAATSYKSDWLSAAGHYRMPAKAAV